MKLFIITLLIPVSAYGAEIYTVDGKPATKIEATKALLIDSDAKVYRCYEVELSSDVTLKKRKEAKSKGSK